MVADDPLDFQALATAQNQDNKLLQELQADPQHYALVLMDHNVQLICYMPQANAPWKICIPDALLDHTITWYHLVLSHVGIVRSYETMSLHFYHRDMQMRIQCLVRDCDACQRY